MGNDGSGSPRAARDAHPAPALTGPVTLPDGSVIVPADVAGELVAAAVRDLTARARRDGVLISPRAQRILSALQQAADRHDAARFVNEPTPAAPATVEVDSADAALAMGCTVQHVTRLCRSGRLLARRIGRGWLITRASLDAYRYGETHQWPEPLHRIAT